MSGPVYAIGDIHGQYALFETALRRIEADGGAAAPMVSLGDLVDRGPDSRRVITHMIEARAEGRDWTVLKGNHDRLFQGFLEQGSLGDARLRSDLDWLHPRMGGGVTLASYGVWAVPGRAVEELLIEAREAVPPDHLAFLRDMPAYHLRGDLLFVHAGIAPGVPLEAQSEDDLLWIRAPFLDHTAPHPWLVVHGHTALTAPAHYGNRVNLDSGAGYGRPLTVAVFEEGRVWTLEKEGRKPLMP